MSFVNVRKIIAILKQHQPVITFFFVNSFTINVKQSADSKWNIQFKAMIKFYEILLITNIANAFIHDNKIECLFSFLWKKIKNEQKTKKI